VTKCKQMVVKRVANKCGEGKYSLIQETRYMKAVQRKLVVYCRMDCGIDAF